MYLDPGDVVFSSHADDMLVATPGVGVLISIYEVDLKIGAMGYVLLPDVLLEAFPNLDKADPVLMAKSFEPIDNCLGEMKRRGAGKGRIRLRLIGGTSYPGDRLDAATKNYVFVKEAMNRKKIPVYSESMGGEKARRVYFFPTTGRIVQKMLRRDIDFQYVEDAEKAFQEKITKGA